MPNILLKAFDGAKYNPLLKAAFRDRPVGTCISITNLPPPHFAEIAADRHVWMPAKPLRDASYAGVDWSAVAPLDEELIMRMRHCEAIFLPMLDRYARRGDIPYAERKRQYLTHLRFWSHTLDAEKIGLFLINHTPHQCFDYVIYELCKLKGIPTYNLERCYSVPGVFLVPDFERSAAELVPAQERLRAEYADPAKPIPLSPPYEAFYQAESTKGEKPWFTGERAKHLTRSSFFAKWFGMSLSFFRRKPSRFLRALFSPDVWARKLSQHHAARFYDAHIRQPDFSKPYVYAPLHMQPEETTSPRGGAFVNQELVIQLLAACVPPGVGIYVKEHPAQGEHCRSVEFYQSMSVLPQVTFVPRDCDTFTLEQNAVAVATVTGTAGFEGLFKGKPVLLFGHRFYQYAPGVHPVRTADDCRRAVADIFGKKLTPSLRDMRLFLKAVEDCSVPLFGAPPKTDYVLLAESMRHIGERMHKILAPLFM